MDTNDMAPTTQRGAAIITAILGTLPQSVSIIDCERANAALNDLAYRLAPTGVEWADDAHNATADHIMSTGLDGYTLTSGYRELVPR